MKKEEARQAFQLYARIGGIDGYQAWRGKRKEMGGTEGDWEKSLKKRIETAQQAIEEIGLRRDGGAILEVLEEAILRPAKLDRKESPSQSVVRASLALHRSERSIYYYINRAMEVYSRIWEEKESETERGKQYREGKNEMTAAQKVKMALAYTGIRESELARRMGMSAGNLSSKLKKNRFSAEELERIAEMLGGAFEYHLVFDEAIRI